MCPARLARPDQIRLMLTGGDRRSIADSNRVRAVVERDPSLVAELARLTADPDWLVVLRALDLLEKLARAHPDWVDRYRKVFIGPLADSDKWEIRLQVVRALPVFRWRPGQLDRVVGILRAGVAFPQAFVRAWALDGLATLSQRNAALRPMVLRSLRSFERSTSRALQARARNIRARLAAGTPARR